MSCPTTWEGHLALSRIWVRGVHCKEAPLLAECREHREVGQQKSSRTRRCRTVHTLRKPSDLL
jgi:hypothetical protein